MGHVTMLATMTTNFNALWLAADILLLDLEQGLAFWVPVHQLKSRQWQYSITKADQAQY